MNATKIILTLSLLMLTATARPCTTAVISGKATTDGRPMIWKLRDSDTFDNCMRYFADGRLAYLGLVDSNDFKGENVWGGTNEAGFAIMNSASFNVNENDTASLKDQEGHFMKQALQTCTSLQDFENLLRSRPRPMGLAAHFGVIDARGGAAFYEVNNYGWTKFDANETAEGYVLRTNYSQTGTPDVGYGFIRRQTAEKIFAENRQQLNPQTVLQRFSRCFFHPVFGVDFRERYESGRYESPFISSDDFITRQGSSSTIAVQGVRPGEPADMNTVWVQVGFPETCITLPLWVRGGDAIPRVLRYDETLKNSPLNDYAKAWKNRAYPIGRSDGYHYLKMVELVNSDHTGILQHIEQAEASVFRETADHLSRWMKKPPSPRDITDFYQSLDDRVIRFYTVDHAADNHCQAHCLLPFP
ncbi:MAG: hypothetical protein I3J02_04930 [Prevotella sp.]|nr:hypothetical protein [Prevotella sp.]